MGKANEKDKKKITQRMDSRSNLMGKFTQSVRRIAQDFQDPGTPGGMSKDEAIKTQLRLRHTRRRLEESYETTKRALVNLHNEYEKSKEIRNIFTRYALLKTIIKEILSKEIGNKSLVESDDEEEEKSGKKSGRKSEKAKASTAAASYKKDNVLEKWEWDQLKIVDEETKAKKKGSASAMSQAGALKQVVRLETQYWTLLDVPKQEKQEPVGVYVLRACTALEKVQIKPSEKSSVENEERTREEKERLEDMTSTQIEAENTQLINDLYRLLKRYAGLRNLLSILKTEYSSAKYYPIIPRYMLLKDMVLTIIRDPVYMEVCHEVQSRS